MGLLMNEIAENPSTVEMAVDWLVDMSDVIHSMSLPAAELQEHITVFCVSLQTCIGTCALSQPSFMRFYAELLLKDTIFMVAADDVTHTVFNIYLLLNGLLNFKLSQAQRIFDVEQVCSFWGKEAKTASEFASLEVFITILKDAKASPFRPTISVFLDNLCARGKTKPTTATGEADLVLIGTALSLLTFPFLHQITHAGTTC